MSLLPQTRKRTSPSVTCPLCERISYHPEDIKHRYCGHCRVFWGELPLSDYEIEEWIARLGINRQERMSVLRDLLRNANGDSMSVKDLSICMRELRRLQEAEWQAKGVKPPQPIIRPVGSKQGSKREQRPSDTRTGTLGHEAEGPHTASSDSVYPSVPACGAEKHVPDALPGTQTDALEQAS